ncbi:MAG: hypothetical protein IJW62_04980 [Clostridia bacterium]|nr:hypothetical protein [Clostridia bacterium]
MKRFVSSISTYFRQNWRRLLTVLLYPPLWMVILLPIVSGAATVWVLVKGWDENPAVSPVYVAAFYSLTVVTMRCIRYFPGWFRSGKSKVHSTRYGGLFLTNVEFRTTVTLYGSLAINLLYILLNAGLAIYYHTAWFGILSGYYAILAILRFLLARYVKKAGIGTDRIGEYRRSRLCGVILLTLNLTLTGAVLMILYQDRGYEYGGMLIYVMAAYTFYITTHAIIDIIKFRKYNSPVMSATKRINLSAALVSMLALETAMLSQFGKDQSPQFRRIMIAATGAGISLTVIAMSIFMIVIATRAIRNDKEKER